MAKFEVDATRIKNESSSMNSMVSEIASLSEELEEVMNHISMQSSSVTAIKSELSTLVDSMCSEKDIMEKCSTALNQIAELYENTESAIKDSDSLSSVKESMAQISEQLEKLRAAMKGMDGACDYSIDPVNLCNGNYVYEKTFFQMKADYPVKFRVFYNSMDSRRGILGKGWMHNYEVFLGKKSNDQIYVILEDGSELTFVQSRDLVYQNPVCPLDCIREEKNQFHLILHTGINYIFSRQGRLLSESDLNGNSIEFQYEESGLLVGVSEKNQTLLRFCYSKKRQLILVDMGVGRSLKVDYETGNMSEITYLVGEEKKQLQKYQYKYDEEVRLTHIIDGDGKVILLNCYDNNNRVILQKFADGGTLKYDYLDREHTVRMTEQNGHQIQYVHDAQYRSTDTIEARGKASVEYNEFNQKIKWTDRLGNMTHFRYDELGRLAEIVDAIGVKKKFSYAKKNQLKEYELDGVKLFHGEYDECGNIVRIEDAVGRVQKISYDKYGHPIKVILPDGSEAELTYDDSGNLAKIKNAAGVVTEYEYDRWNRVTAVIDGNKNRTRFWYNHKDDIVKVVNADGAERNYRYNENGMLIEVNDFDGSIYKTQYNELNKPSNMTDACGNVTKFEYDSMWNLVRQIAPNQSVTKYFYDEYNQKIREEDPYGFNIEYTYDSNGNCIFKKGKKGEIYEYQYDVLNRLIKTREPDGEVTKYQYNAAGAVTRVTNSYGKSREFEYNNAGQKIKATDEAGNCVYYQYNSLGQIGEVGDRAAMWIKYAYLPGGKLRKVSYSNGRFLEFTYDENGNLVEKRNQDEFITRYHYDCMNEIVYEEDNEGMRCSYTYDAVGNLLSKEDSSGNRMDYGYTRSGKLSCVKDPFGNKAEYTYDCMDQLIVVRQSGNFPSEQHEIKYQRDQMGRAIKITDPLGVEENYQYDAYGNIVQITNADGYETTYEYTVCGMPSMICYGDGRSVKYSYNLLKQLVEFEDWLGITKIEPDELGRASKVTDYNNCVLEYERGKYGEPRRLVYPDGTQMNYEYDDLLHLTRMESGGNEVKYQYDNAGRMIQKKDSNKLVCDYKYARCGQIQSIKFSDELGMIQNVQYEYNENHLCKKQQINDGMNGSTSVSYVYDELNRISEVMEDGNLIRSFQYDAFGNRLTKEEKGSITSYTYNAANQLILKQSGEIKTEYKYDGRGNLVEEACGDEIMTFYFDATNRLSRMSKFYQHNIDQEVTSAKFQYNGLGYRMNQTTALHLKDAHKTLSSMQYLVDMTKPVDHYLEVQQPEETYHYMWNKGVDMIYSKEKNWSVGNDRIQSPICYLSLKGDRKEIAYDEFGCIHNQGDQEAFGYTGYLKEEIGPFYFAQAREYAPMDGRFLSKDPVAGAISMPVSLNRYTYCYNDGMNQTDRTGYWFGLDDAIAAGVGAAVSLGAQLVTDTVEGVVTGDFSYDWEDYVGAAVGGAAGGVTTLYAGPIAGCAVESGVSTGLSGVIQKVDGKSDASVTEIAVDTAVSTGLGALFGKIIPDIPIKGITKGRGNYSAVFKAGITKIQRGIAHRMSAKVIAKGVASSLLGGAFSTFVSGITSEGYEDLKDFIKDQYKKYQQEQEEKKEQEEEESTEETTAECPLAAN